VDETAKITKKSKSKLMTQPTIEISKEELKSVASEEVIDSKNKTHKGFKADVRP